MNDIELRLLNEFQRNWPLDPQPYHMVAEKLGTGAAWVIERLARLQRDGVISRIGAVFAPGAIGASTLAALEVPAERLSAVAEMISAFSEVNHNYEREHRINLWFVATAPSEGRLAQVLAEIERKAQCGPLLALRLVEEFRIDLGFDLRGDGETSREAPPRPPPAAHVLTPAQSRLVAALQEGLGLVPRPFAALGDVAGLGEDEVLEQMRRWIAAGVIRRLGVIVRHRELGYRANAMVVWDLPDTLVRPFGINLARRAGVTLCYRRARAQPRWPYNLYCMIHGRSRQAVLSGLADLEQQTGLSAFARQILFSRTRYKQTGARYLPTKALAYG